MSTGSRKLRPPVKWHGGKHYLAGRIIRCFPEHRTYVEPFVGGGSVLINKPAAEREFAGDLNAGLIGLWQQIKAYDAKPDYPWNGSAWATFGWMVGQIQYCEGNFDLALEGYYTQASPRFGPALDFLIRNRFSRGGLGKAFAWSERLRGGQPGDANAWDTIRAELPAICERVRGVAFRCGPALDLIREHDAADTLTYLDPPYLHETRTARAAYAHEMTREDHERLLDRAYQCIGTFFLSGYRSEMYDAIAATRGWHRIQWDLPNHSGQGKAKQRRVEALWSNSPFPGSERCRAAYSAKAVEA